MKRKSLIIALSVILFLALGGIATGKIITNSKSRKNLDLGNKYLLEGNYQQAILAFEEVIRIQPKNVQARIGLAKAYIELEQYEDCERVLKDALDIDPDNPECYVELANLYMKTDRIVDAFKILDEGYTKCKDEKIASKLQELEAQAAVANIEETIIQGNQYNLPQSVEVTVDSMTGQFPVKWNIEAVDTSNSGTYTHNGKLSYMNKEVALTINVISISSIDDISVTVKQKEPYTLPQKIKAKMTDNSVIDVDVTWNPSTLDTSKIGTSTFEGSVKGYEGKVKLTINVKSAYDGSTKVPKEVTADVLKVLFKLYGRDIFKAYGTAGEMDYFSGGVYKRYGSDNLLFFFDADEPTNAAISNSRVSAVWFFGQDYSVLNIKLGMNKQEAEKVSGLKFNQYYDEAEGMGYVLFGTNGVYELRMELDSKGGKITSIMVK